MNDPVNFADSVGLAPDEWEPGTSHTYGYRGSEYHVEVDGDGTIHVSSEGKKSPDDKSASPCDDDDMPSDSDDSQEEDLRKYWEDVFKDIDFSEFDFEQLKNTVILPAEK